MALYRLNLETVANCYDVPCKLISLHGTAKLESQLPVKLQFSNLLDGWVTKGISSKKGFDERDFKITKVQDNFVVIENQLSNLDCNGQLIQKWGCTYVLSESGTNWKISLATFNSKAST